MRVLWRLRGLGLILCLGFALLGQTRFSFAQDTDALIVAFVEDNDLRTAVTGDTGADGVSRLAEIFRAYGAITQVIDLDSPIPSEVDVIVMISPSRPLAASHLSYLWDALLEGKNLLLALEPNGYQGVGTERRNGGLDRLFSADYGVGLQDTILLAPWFSPTSMQDIVNAWTVVKAENVIGHAIIALHQRYDLPIWTWGTRSFRVDAFGENTIASPLLYSETGYGETSSGLFGTTPTNPMQLNIGTDEQGHLLLAALAFNRATGSRIVVLGDGQLTQNIFGLTRLETNANAPLLLGNDLFVRRLVGWILEKPQTEWADMPDIYSRIAFDGNATDWIEENLVYSDVAFDVSPLGHDIQRIGFVQTDYYAYLLLETGAPVRDDLQIGIRYQSDGGLQSLVLQGHRATTSTPNGLNLRVLDADYVYNNHVEIRLPLRLFTETPTISQICLRMVSVLSTDCVDLEMVASPTDKREAVSTRHPDGAMAIVRTNSFVNLRAAPNETGTVITRLNNREIFAALGRNEAGTWVLVENGLYRGWLASFLVGLNTDILSLPVME